MGIFRKKNGLRLLWLTVGAVVALAWGEAFTRVLLPQNRDTVLDILVPDPVVGYIYEPNVVMAERGRDYDVPFVTNRLGLRDREIGPKRDGVFRVLLMGNSFSVSHGVEIENSLSRAVERALNTTLDTGERDLTVEVVNGSNAGYNAYNYRMGYPRWKDVIDPDLVLVGFVSAREIKCDDEDTRYLVEDGLLMGRYRAGETPPRIRRNPLTAVRKHLARNSDLYVLMRNYLYYNEKADKIFRRGKENNSAVEQVRPYRNPPSDGTLAKLQKAHGQLGKLKKETAADGVPMAVIAIPEVTEVDTAHRENLAVSAGLTPASLEPDQPFALLADYCREQDIPLLDTRLAVARAHREKAAYFQYDRHWNARGIGAAAETVAEQWRLLSLPPFNLPPVPGAEVEAQGKDGES